VADNGNGDRQWRLTKEKILMAVGVALMFGTFVDSQFLQHPFHFEYLVAGMACCGVAITTWGRNG
jgi:hypothetical protein